MTSVLLCLILISFCSAQTYNSAPMYVCDTFIQCVSPTDATVAATHPCSAASNNVQCCRDNGQTDMSMALTFTCTSAGLTCEVGGFQAATVRAGSKCFWGLGDTAAARLSMAQAFMAGEPPMYTPPWPGNTGVFYPELLPSGESTLMMANPAPGFPPASEYDASFYQHKMSCWGSDSASNPLFFTGGVFIAGQLRAQCSQGNPGSTAHTYICNYPGVPSDPNANVKCSRATDQLIAGSWFTQYSTTNDPVYNNCGNGYLNIQAGSVPAEQCDDGNTNSADGCSATCTVESGYTCPTAGSPCSQAAATTTSSGTSTSTATTTTVTTSADSTTAAPASTSASTGASTSVATTTNVTFPADSTAATTLVGTTEPSSLLEETPSPESSSSKFCGYNWPTTYQVTDLVPYCAFVFAMDSGP